MIQFLIRTPDKVHVTYGFEFFIYRNTDIIDTEHVQSWSKKKAELTLIERKIRAWQHDHPAFSNLKPFFQGSTENWLYVEFLGTSSKINRLQENVIMDYASRIENLFPTVEYVSDFALKEQ